MDLDLARIYGTPGQKVASAAQEEQLEKQAQAELFAKLAADNGIDLSTLTDDQIGGLWAETFGQKLAEDDDKKDEKKDEPEAKRDDEKDEDEKKAEAEKVAAAAAELAAAQEEQQKLAFADQAGRVMAHAMVNELNSINEAIAKEAMEKEALSGAEVGARGRHLFGKAKEVASKLKDVATAKELRQGLAAEKNVKSDIGTRMLQAKALKEVPKGQREAAIKGNREYLTEAARKAQRSGAAKTVGLYGAAAGAAGGAAALHKKKESSALDQLALEAALEKAAAAGYDIDEAIERLAAVETLGLGESEKVASAPVGDLDAAVGIRSLEYLEAAGYPVEWTA